MKFLLDVCAASRDMWTTLTDLGHDVLSAMEHAPRASDEELLALAVAEGRALITEDKDFGELVFVRRLPHPCIIRFGDMSVLDKVSAMLQLIEQESEAIERGNIIVVTRERIRIRDQSD